MQLFMEGPRDKVVIFLEVDSFWRDYPLELEEFLGKTMGQLMRAELCGTTKALVEAKRPYAKLRINRLDPAALGATIVFFQALTVGVGLQLGVNPFDQPGVELGKKYAREYLGDSGSISS